MKKPRRIQIFAIVSAGGLLLLPGFIAFAQDMLAGVPVYPPAYSTQTGENKLYGPVTPRAYLTGHFRPAKHPGFIPLSALGLPTRGQRHYLRRETAQALAAMLKEFRQAHPHTEVWVASAGRSFYRQKTIWENKWLGRRKVNGKNLSIAFPDPVARAAVILQYSALPGASRHHWGTDIDFNKLQNRYYTSGSGATLYEWLQAHATRFGFCQPYTAGRVSGHKEERWHWSYRPLASRFLRQWKKLYGDKTKFMEHNRFQGASTAAPLAPFYMDDINSDCR